MNWFKKLTARQSSPHVKLLIVYLLLQTHNNGINRSVCTLVYHYKNNIYAIMTVQVQDPSRCAGVSAGFWQKCKYSFRCPASPKILLPDIHLQDPVAPDITSVLQHSKWIMIVACHKFKYVTTEWDEVIFQKNRMRVCVCLCVFTQMFVKHSFE